MAALHRRRPTTQRDEESMSETHHEQAHTGPIKTPKQLLWASILAFVVPVFIIIGLVKFIVR
jgi:hypothetical protein